MAPTFYIKLELSPLRRLALSSTACSSSLSFGFAGAAAASFPGSASKVVSHQIGPPSPLAHEMQPVACDGRIWEPSVLFRLRIGTRQSMTVPCAVSRR